MNVLDLRVPAGSALAGNLTVEQPEVARLACLAAAGVLQLETRMVRAGAAFEEGSVQLQIYPRLPELVTRGDGRIDVEIARITGCPAVAVDLRAGSPGWFE